MFVLKCLHFLETQRRANYRIGVRIALVRERVLRVRSAEHDRATLFLLIDAVSQSLDQRSFDAVQRSAALLFNEVSAVQRSRYAPPLCGGRTPASRHGRIVARSLSWCMRGCQRASLRWPQAAHGSTIRSLSRKKKQSQPKRLEKINLFPISYRFGEKHVYKSDLNQHRRIISQGSRFDPISILS